MPWNAIAAVALIGFIVAMGIFGLYAHARASTACDYCAFPRDKCTCPKPECEHAYGPTRWTQDGWVRVCKFCRRWDYRGDDYDGGPK